MTKDIYLINGIADESYEQFSTRILFLAESLKNQKEIDRLSVTFTSNPPPIISIIPFKNKKIAAISVYPNKIYSRNSIVNEPGFFGAYEVNEALPVAYKKDWPDKQVTPGACLLTLFRQKKGISYDTFINRWHNGHTPLSLKIHPLWHYNRNVVKEKITNLSYEWNGIVEEHTRTKTELLNPLKFFGNPFTMIYNMARVYFDTQSFLDYKTIETYLVTEIHIKS